MLLCNWQYCCINLILRSLCYECLFLCEAQIGGGGTVCTGGRIHLCNSSYLLIRLTVTQVLAMEDQPLWVRGQWGVNADWCVYLFINRQFAIQLCLRVLFSPVSPPEVWDRAVFGIRSVLGMQDHANAHAHIRSSIHLTLMPTMNETVMTVKAGGRMKGGVQDSWDHGKADPILIVLVRESSGF